MHYVYVLTNQDQTKHYIGFSSNLQRRLKEHQEGRGNWTKQLESCQLYYYEAYNTAHEARSRESKLKQYGSAYQGLLKRIELK